MLKESGVATLETTLENAGHCMAKAMCKHGATKAMAKEDAFYVAMKTFTAFLKSVQEASTRSTKHIDALTGALRVGSAMGEGACHTLYPCPETENQMQGRRGEVRVHFQLKASFQIQTLLRHVSTRRHSARDSRRAARCAESSTRHCAGEFVRLRASLADPSATSATQSSQTTTSQKSEPFDGASSVCKLTLYRNKFFTKFAAQ